MEISRTSVTTIEKKKTQKHNSIHEDYQEIAKSQLSHRLKIIHSCAKKNAKEDDFSVYKYYMSREYHEIYGKMLTLSIKQ